MDVLSLLAVAAAAAFVLKSIDQRRRIALLGRHLRDYRIEKLMEDLTQGYLRALGEGDPQRRAQIWPLLGPAEASLAGQFGQFAAAFARVAPEEARISTLPVALPFADRWLPSATFDARQAFAIHARGIAAAAANERGRSPKDRAFVLMAEMLLMQHTCHWFCRSRMVATARMQARHQTRYAQLVDAVDPETRRAYAALVGLR
ncbi:MAG: hypothetical protein PGN26_06170 [Xylophilus ampelinus]